MHEKVVQWTGEIVQSQWH